MPPHKHMDNTLDKDTYVWFGYNKGKKWSRLPLNSLRWYEQEMPGGAVAAIVEKEIARRDALTKKTGEMDYWFYGYITPQHKHKKT